MVLYFGTNKSVKITLKLGEGGVVGKGGARGSPRGIVATQKN